MRHLTFVTKNIRVWLARSLSAVITLLIVGCATPEPLTAAPEVPLSKLTVTEARDTPPATPQTVRWGGTIVGVTNTEDEKTRVEIVSRPLQRSGRPINDDRSDGRFIAEFNEFLDPEIVKVGREMSVVGTVSDTLEGSIGATRYTFPRLLVSDSRYWKPLPERSAYRYSPYYDPYGYGHFYHGPYRRHPFHGGFYGRFYLHRSLGK